MAKDAVDDKFHGIQEVEDGPGPGFASVDVDQGGRKARQATAAEHNLSLWQALKTYRRAALWSILISTTVIMEGYDVTLLGSFFGYPAFRRKYGYYVDATSGYQISSAWQSALNDLAGVGNLIGALLNGWLTARYGHRRVLMACLAALTALIFITFFAPNLPVLLVGTFLCNIPWGFFATTGPSYAAEVAPLALRGYLTAYVNLCWCIGQFISAGVLKGLVNDPTEWSYRIPFAVQWAWPVPLFVAAWLAPESPWFLVRTGQLERAKASLRRLSDPSSADGDTEVDHDATIALMVHTDRLEREERAGVTYWDAFRGTNLRRTEIACVAFLAQVTDGGALCYSGTFFFQQTGIDANTSYALGLAGTAVGFCGTLASSLWMARFGRRAMFLGGFYALVVVLFVIGFLACAPDQTPALAWAQSALSLVWLGAYSMTVGPVVYTIVAEIGSTRLRTQTVVLGRSTYYVANIVGGVMEPYLISPTAWNAKGKTAFFWGGLSFLTTVWAYFRLPETKDRTFAEMDVLFQKGVPAREFSKHELSNEDMDLAEKS